MKVELLKYPTQEDWNFCKACTLNTMGKKLVKDADSEWKRKILASEHSPIRELWFAFRVTCPYWVSVHLVRHHDGINHYVQSQRNDRQSEYDRNTAPQGQEVSHIVSVNAQELMYIARKRLCAQASEETRSVVYAMCRLATEVCPELDGLLVPNCVYRGGVCTEFFSCGGADAMMKKYGKK